MAKKYFLEKSIEKSIEKELNILLEKKYIYII